MLETSSYKRSNALLHLAEAVALGALVTLVWQACCSKHRHRRDARCVRKPEAEHTWEGEGGRPLPTQDEAGSA